MLTTLLNKQQFGNLFSFELNKENTLILDLSKDNNESAFQTISSSNELDHYIQQKIQQDSKKYAFGGYLENRVVYQRFKHFNDQTSDERYIHLGIDVWCNALEPIYAPFDSTVHSYGINDHEGDYGGTIILKHVIDQYEFHTLYGHLSHSSIENLSAGAKLKAGDLIGYIGNDQENGGWPPHLHFQIIKDMQGYLGDYPGVTSYNNLEKMKSNCPDPNLILKTFL